MSECVDSNRYERRPDSDELMDTDLRERDDFVKRLFEKDEKLTTKSGQSLSSEQIRDVSLRGSLHDLDGCNRNRYGGTYILAHTVYIYCSQLSEILPE